MTKLALIFHWLLVLLSTWDGNGWCVWRVALHFTAMMRWAPRQVLKFLFTPGMSLIPRVPEMNWGDWNLLLKAMSSAVQTVCVLGRGRMNVSQQTKVQMNDWGDGRTSEAVRDSRRGLKVRHTEWMYMYLLYTCTVYVDCTLYEYMYKMSVCMFHLQFHASFIFSSLYAGHIGHSSFILIDSQVTTPVNICHPWPPQCACILGNVTVCCVSEATEYLQAQPCIDTGLNPHLSVQIIQV